MLPLPTLAQNLGIAPEHLIQYGRDKAKVALEALEAARARRPRPGKLILVSAITPTPAGEGKTVTSIGLAQGLRKLDRSVALALRQPSMGPVFGRKGGATGGGLSTVQPATDINLHFTGDFHAVTAAHNLLASVIDNALHRGQTRLAPGGVLWKRVLDANDRALRSVRVAVGDPGERLSGFDITAASEIMAILCLAASRDDLRARLDRLVVGFTADGEPVPACEFRVTGALMALLRDALLPNLVQSAEGVPAFVHGGPFANIAHGCNSILATRMALAHADYVVTEAGFAFDLGGEKFIDIKCRQSGLAPDAIVIVATIRALKMHGGMPRDALAAPDLPAIRCGLENLRAHVGAAASFNRPVVVAINHFPTDTDAELALVRDFCAAELRVPCALSQVFARGGEGGTELAGAVLSLFDGADAAAAISYPKLEYVYPDDIPVTEKINTIARRIYGASGVDILPGAAARLVLFERAGFGRLPICMAKTQDSLTDDPKKPGRPQGFRITVRDFELAAGAGFIVALTGKMLRMPALPKVPAAEKIDLAPDGAITGIMGT
ncbi:formate--tetrahydrofolate ligase [Termitidicoccus mucosus]|uniref:Formate--tetrahydrofolate ligase n=1 Tax=Termitidicoccus mucosus TaxID=1184151 RepID=A0A178IGT5_9BACT|nr:formate--tetrahydrofolate ligase [Opitutaceae bacterium TSB47]